MPRGQKLTAEQIIEKLREADVESSQAKTLRKVVRKLGVTRHSHDRWEREYGGLQADQATRLKDLGRSNARLKRLPAVVEIEKAILRETTSGRRRRA